MSSIRVQLDPRATKDEAELVSDVLMRFDVAAEVQGEWKTRGEPQPGMGDEPEWIIYMILGYPILRFLDGFLGEAGADAWKRLRDFASSLASARRKNPPWQGSIQFREPSGRETVVSMIPEPPSDDAWVVLLELDWEALPQPEWMVVQWFERVGTWIAFEPSLTGEGASLYWDRKSREWLHWDQRSGEDVPNQR